MASRRDERVDTTLALALEGGGNGIARNVSASGIYFETELFFAEGSPVFFTLDFADSPGGPMRAKCHARIVRVEQKNGKIGVGARIDEFVFERVTPAGTDVPGQGVTNGHHS